MATEIERKFLVSGDGWRTRADAGVTIRQGYLAGNERASVRVRRSGEQANLNIKSATLGVWRREYEYPIPAGEADEMLDHLCGGALVEKIRYTVDYAGHTWEIDEFLGDNAGLIVAEVELSTEDERPALPDWAGLDVSHEPRYYNTELARHPFRQWTWQERNAQ